jgi:hypothetical protein
VPRQRGKPGPSSGSLADGLLTPTDMGGFYQVSASGAQAIAGSAPCLAGLAAAPSQSGRALTGLFGPDYGSVPTIVEQVVSYPGSSASLVYASIVRSMQGCGSFSFDLGGARYRVPLRPEAMQSPGDPSRAYAGTFAFSGRTDELQVGVVLVRQELLAMIYVDSVPASDAIMGSFTTTLSAAIGKLP